MNQYSGTIIGSLTKVTALPDELIFSSSEINWSIPLLNTQRYRAYCSYRKSSYSSTWQNVNWVKAT